VILSLIAVDCFTGPTINSADLNDIGVAQFHQILKRDYEKLWGEVSKVLRELSERVAK